MITNVFMLSDIDQEVIFNFPMLSDRGWWVAKYGHIFADVINGQSPRLCHTTKYLVQFVCVRPVSSHGSCPV